MGTGTANTAFVLSCLRRRERLFQGKIVAMILFGLPLSLLSPLLLATIFWFAAWQIFGETWADSTWGQWTTMFWLSVLVVVPLLYHLEIRTGGRYLSETMRDTEVHEVKGAMLVPGAARTAVAVAAIAANPRASSAGVVEVFLFGPRLVVDAVRQIRATRSVRGADRERAASMVLALLSRTEGVATTRLVRKGEKLDDLVPTLAYLVLYRWGGVRDEWRHVWLTSEARRALGWVRGQ